MAHAPYVRNVNPDKPDKAVRTDRVTADRRYFLDYTTRPDEPHNPLHFDFRWVDLDGNVVAGPFQTAQAAYLWQEGYEHDR